MALQQGNPFFYRLYPGRYGIARAGLGSSPLWKIETKDSTFVQVGTKRERERRVNFMDLVSRIRRDRLDERERGTRAMDKRKNRFPPRFYRSCVSIPLSR